MTPSQRLAVVQQAYGGRASKYHAQRCTVHAGRHASLKECRRYGELVLLERAGRIRDLREQVRVPLCDHYDKPLVYVADFVYWEPCEDDGWQEIYEDTKGVLTPVFKIKRHLLADRGITVRVL